MKRKSLSTAILLAAALTIPALPAHGGSGEIVDGKVNLSVMFTYLEADPDSWRPLFDEASELLFNATNGQIQIGEVRVINCAFDKEDADIWVLDGNSGAFATLFGLGGDGHIYLSQTHKSTSGGALGQFGLVHEFGHYAFGVYDEYKGATLPAPPPLAAEEGGELTLKNAVPNQFCVTDEDEIACLMDGGTTVPPNNARTEFCTHAGILSTGHNPGVVFGESLFVNAQEVYNGESCWETIARVAFLDPPEEVQPDDPPGHDAIEWLPAPVFNRLVLAVDRSTSMYQQHQMPLAKEAVHVMVDLLHAKKTVEMDGAQVELPGENVGIVSFARQTSVDFSIREILGESTRDSARAVIDAIGSTALDFYNTDLGGALQASLDEITYHGLLPACSEAIVLVTDGGHNSGTDPEAVLPSLQSRGVKVFSIGMGQEVDEDLLQGLAEETGGEYYFAESAGDLPDILALIASAAREGGIVETFQDSIFGLDELLPIGIDALAEEVTTVLEWGEGVLDLFLTPPSGGDEISVESALEREDVEAARGDNYLYIRIIGPEDGIWQARIHPVDVPEPSAYGLDVFEESRTIDITPVAVLSGGNLRVRVEVVAGVPVAGAEVDAVVERPGGDPVEMEFFDDGDETHGDTWADDGVYGAVFSELTGDGDYVFNIKVVNVDGTGPDPGLPFVEEGNGPPGAIDPFVREMTFTFPVTGTSNLVEGEMILAPETLDAADREGEIAFYVELPEEYSVEGIDVAGARVNRMAAPKPNSAEVADHDGNQVPDLMLVFNRADVMDALSVGMDSAVEITGRVSGPASFRAVKRISVIDLADGPPVGIASDGPVSAGHDVVISWTPVEGEPVAYGGFLSLDGGASWEPIFSGVEGTNEHVWTVEGEPSTNALIVVEADSPEGVLEQDVSPSFSLEDGSVGVGDGPVHATVFLGATPNPLRGSTVLRYGLASDLEVRLEIYDVAGRIVRRLAAGQESAGPHAATWDGRDDQNRRVASGVYLYVFEAGSYTSKGRMMMVR